VLATLKYPSPEHVLRNANGYFVPQYRIELVRRMPLYSFPAAWNAEINEKFNPSPPI
jgi:hypothetical protein